MRKEKEQQHKGKLTIFFGMCAGVGKTYSMLKAAHDKHSRGVDVVIGYVETHGQPETEALLEGFPLILRKRITYRGTTLEEMDIDALLTRKPDLVLIDELAHTNVSGSRHTKRYQDVQELLDNGIDVYTTLNVQHLESRADTIAQITGAIVRETVPDAIFEQAAEVEVIDLPPDELLNRLSEGRVSTPEYSKQAIKGHLTALRAMLLRLAAERADHQLRDYMQTEQISGPWKSGQRLIVGISASPHTVKLIRWARRMAYTMDATWVAVYVETSKPLSKHAQDQLAKHVKLAQELGAEIVTTADNDVVRALIRVARQENATQILIGKSRIPRFFRRNSLLERLIAQSGDLDMYVVGGDEEDATRPWHLTFPEIHSSFLQYLIAGFVMVLVALICAPFTDLIGYHAVSLILLFTVLVLPLKLRAGPVLLAATLGAVVWDFFFIPPLYRFSVDRIEDLLMLVTYFIIAIVTGVLSVRSRTQEKAVRVREEHAVALYTLTRELSRAMTQGEVVRAAVANMKKFFNADVVVYLGEADGDVFRAAHPESSMSVDEKEFRVAEWVYWNEKEAGKFTDTLPFAQATYFCMSGPRYPLGVIGVRLPRKENLSIDQKTLLENFIRQIASALEREFLNDITKKAIVIEESERLYQTLFNSISHELRTPLAAVMSASESLLHEEFSIHPDIRAELFRQIHTAAERLNRLVENLLNMTRLESGLLQPLLDWSDMQDLIHAALKGLTTELSGRPITVDVSPDMPLVKMDFGLIEQVLTNILHNVSEYTPPGSPIEIYACTDKKDCVIALSDHGPGFPADVLRRVFEKFYRAPGTKPGGLGLGLSIAKGFVEAHKGTLMAENRPEGGARLIVRFPLEPEETCDYDE